MTEQGTEQTRQLVREKALYRYSSALERGDFDALSVILKQAEQDPLLERMLLEVNEVYRAEMENPFPQVEQTPRPVEDTPTGWPSARLLRWWRRRQERTRGTQPARPKRRPAGREVWANRFALGGILLGVVLTFLIGYGIYTSQGYDGNTLVSTAGMPGMPSIYRDVLGQYYGLPLSVNEDTSGTWYYVPGGIAPTPLPHRVDDSGPQEGSLSEPTGRMIVRNGNVSIVVEDTPLAQRSIEEMVAEMAGEGAYVVSSNEYGSTTGGAPYILMAIRVPASRFDEAMDRLADLAVEVIARSESGQDVTEEYVDLEATLESLEAARQRLLEIMQSAETTEDLLRAEQQLTEREAKIESIKGRMQYLAQSAQLASISIELQPSILSQPVGARWRPAEVGRRAFDRLVDSLRSLGDFLIFFSIAILPWAVVVGLILYGVIRLVRRRLRRSREKHTLGS